MLYAIIQVGQRVFIQAQLTLSDKNPDNEEAANKFKLVAEANQVLADPELRKKYNQFGKKSARPEEGDLVDPSELFAMIFGGGAFEDIIGKLAVSEDLVGGVEMMNADAELQEEMEKHMANAEDLTSEEKKELKAKMLEMKKASKQKNKETRQKWAKERAEKMDKRIEILTERLTSTLTEYVAAHQDEKLGKPERMNAFDNKLTADTTELNYASFGTEILHHIGSIYADRATVFLKSSAKNMLGVPGFFASIKSKSSSAKDLWNLISTAMDAQIFMMDQAKLSKALESEHKKLSPEYERELEEAMTGKMLLTSWIATKIEINTVLRAVLEKVLVKDKKVSRKIREARAEGLLHIAKVYNSVKVDGEDEWRRMLQKAQEDKQSKGKTGFQPAAALAAAIEDEDAKKEADQKANGDDPIHAEQSRNEPPPAASEH